MFLSTPLPTRPKYHSNPLDARKPPASHGHQSSAPYSNTVFYSVDRTSWPREYRQLQCKCGACRRPYSCPERLGWDSSRLGDATARSWYCPSQRTLYKLRALVGPLKNIENQYRNYVRIKCKCKKKVYCLKF